MAAWSSCVSPQAFRRPKGVVWGQISLGLNIHYVTMQMFHWAEIGGQVILYKTINHAGTLAAQNFSKQLFLHTPDVSEPKQRIYEALVYSTAFQKRQGPVWWQGLQRRGALLQLWLGILRRQSVRGPERGEAAKQTDEVVRPQRAGSADRNSRVCHLTQWLEDLFWPRQWCESVAWRS